MLPHFSVCGRKYDYLYSFDCTGHPSTSLDDSLTNIQWLCQLESNPFLETQRTNNAATSETTSMNPYPKPPFSYATLILLAINSTTEKRMTLQDIYKWIEDNFPYYKHCKKAWKVTADIQCIIRFLKCKLQYKQFHVVA